MSPSPFASQALFHVGPVAVATPVVVTWGIMALLVGVSWLGTRRLALVPGRLQSILEVVVETMQAQIRDVAHTDPEPLLPLLGTLFLLLLAANLSSLVPGVSPPTGRLETPLALAAVVFVAVHVFGVRARGLRGYLATFVEPNPLLLPFNVLAELTRTFSLAVRLFGNVMSHEFVIGIVLSLAGLLVPVPLMALGLLIGVVQAFIFTILATVYVGAAVGERGARRRA